MSKGTIRHGGTLSCDMVTVHQGRFTGQCKSLFVTYSVSGLTRKQAIDAGWVRPKAYLVSWPGTPPMADAKKADLCPEHAKLAITFEEYKAKRKAERADAKQTALDKRAARAAAREEAKQKKAKRKAERDALKMEPAT